MVKTTKKKGTIIDKIMKSTDDAKSIGYELSKVAVSKGQKIGSQITKEGTKRLQDTVEAAKKVALTSKDNIELIKQLGELREAGLITKNEFEQKKKEILSRI